MILADFKDKHKGKLAFCVGAGPSLHEVHKNALDNNIVFTVNSAISKFENCQYFVADDYAIKYWSYFETLNKKKCIKFFYKEKLKNKVSHLDQKKIVWFDHRYWQDPVDRRYKPDSLIMSQDPTVPLIGARTALATAINVAFIMGCSPIVLLGADCCLKDGKRYFWEFDGEKKQQSIIYDKKHEYKTEDKVQLDHHSKSFMKYWKDFRKMNPDVEIYNASGGILDVFPKEELSYILRDY